jgi:hypothetical protein
MAGRRQRARRLVDRELRNRVGVFLLGRSEALVGVGRVEKFGGGIDAIKVDLSPSAASRGGGPISERALTLRPRHYR